MDRELQACLKSCMSKIIPFSDSVQAALVEMNKTPVNIPVLSHQLELDPLLASVILRLANSPFYGFARKIGNVQDAAVLLGMHSLKQLVISFSLVKTFNLSSGGGLNRRALWQHSVAVAVTAKTLAPRCKVNPDEAFIAGMLHDIGQFILDLCLAEDYAEVLKFRDEQACPLHVAEQERLGIHHGQVAAGAINNWRLPKAYAQVALHHYGDLRQPPASPLVDLVHLSDVLTKGLWISPENDPVMIDLCPQTLPRLGLDWAAIERLLPEIESMSHEVIGRLLH